LFVVGLGLVVSTALLYDTLFFPLDETLFSDMSNRIEQQNLRQVAKELLVLNYGFKKKEQHQEGWS